MPCGCKKFELKNGVFHVKQQPKEVHPEIQDEVESEALAGPPTERDVSGVSNTAALSVECFTEDLGLSSEDAHWLVNLGVGCSSNDDALSVLGHAFTAAIERAKELEVTLDARDVALASLEESYEALEQEYNDLVQGLEGAYSEVPEKEDGDVE